MSKKIFSVVIPFYNNSEHLKNLNDSLVENREYIFEVIIVDDNSSPEESFLLTSFSFDLAVVVVSIDENSGPSRARNIGFHKSSAPYIAFLDSDDVWLKGRLRLIHSFIDKFDRYNSDILINRFSYGKRFDANLHLDFGMVKPINLLSLLFSNKLQPSCTIVKRDGFLLFDESFRYSEDYEFLLRCYRSKKSISIFDQPLTKLGRVQGSSGGLSSNKLLMRWGEIRAYASFCRGVFLPLLPFLVFFSVFKHLVRVFRGG